MRELRSKCCGAEVVMQYKILKDGYSLGRGYKVCSKCHKPTEVKEKKEDQQYVDDFQRRRW